MGAAFALSVNHKNTRFRYLYDYYCHAFLAKLNPCYKIPSPDLIVWQIISDCYEQTAESALVSIRNEGGGVLGIDGATNILSKSVSNFIYNLPQPFFI